MFSLRPFNVFHHFVHTHCLGFLCYKQPLHPPATPHAPTISHFVVFFPRHGYAGVGMGKPAEWCVGKGGEKSERQGSTTKMATGGAKTAVGSAVASCSATNKSPASACSCTLDAIFLAALAEAVPRVVWLLFRGGEGVSFWIPTPLLCCSLLFPHHRFSFVFAFFIPTRGGCFRDHYEL